MAQFLENAVFLKRRNKRHSTGILEGGEKVKLTGLLCDSFFIDTIIGRIDEKDNWTFRYAKKRLQGQYPSDEFYIRIRCFSNISRGNNSSLYVSYDVFMKEE